MGNYRYLTKHFLPLRGMNSGTVRNAPISRSYAAKIFAAYQGKDLYAQEAVYYFYTNDLVNGTTGKNDYRDFAPERNLTRAEAVDIMYRMDKGEGRYIKGLSAKPSGRDNAKYAKPPKFDGDEEIEFERPGQTPLPDPHPGKPSDRVEVDIEKPVLIANGKDETYITFTFRDCNGEPIPYEQELEFEVSSKEGAKIIVDPPVPGIENKPIVPPPSNDAKPEVPEDDKKEEEDPDREFAELNSAVAIATTASSWNPHVISDGPEVTVKIQAPRSTTKKVDTITVSPVGKNGVCLLPAAAANITYEPMAEIQLDIIEDAYNPGTTRIIATMARPGGATITGFNGYLKLGSLYSLPFEESFIKFTNGVAQTSFRTPTTLMKNEITASAIANESVTDSAVLSILENTYSESVSYAPPLSVDNACTNEKPEIGFLIDSSGSMTRNDPDRLRVTKTKEFIETLNADVNIATHFTTSGMFLKKGIPAPVIDALVKGVRQRGGTSIANGMKVAFEKFTTTKPKTLILLTDGKSSPKPILAELERAKSLGIKIYTIGLGDNLDTTLLEKIAKETGGHYFSIKENIELPLVYQSILQEINCGTPVQSCSLSASIFEMPSVQWTSGDILMSTEVLSACGPIEKVIVRFASKDGNLDYELTHRRQGLYMLNKKRYEIQDFQLSSEATFIAYDRSGNEIGQQKVRIHQ